MHDRHRKAMAALLCRSQPRHDLYTVFSDCMEVMAIAMANSVDRIQFDRREARYLQIVRQYRPDIVNLFPRVLAELVNALEAGISDVLGPLFHDLELHNKARGQFFTSYSICQMMAAVSFDDEADLRAHRTARLYSRDGACLRRGLHGHRTGRNHESARHQLSAPPACDRHRYRPSRGPYGL